MRCRATTVCFAVLIVCSACNPCPDGEGRIRIGGVSYCGERCPGGCGTCGANAYCKQTVGGDRICVDASFLRANGGSLRCGLDDGGGSTSCEPGQVRTNVDGVIHCLDQCVSDADCWTCCVPQASGYRLCAPTPGHCVPGGFDDAGVPSGHMCTDLSHCVSVTATQEPCSYDSSLLDVRAVATNVCSQPVMVELCFEVSGVGWRCYLSGALPPGGEMRNGGGCGRTGRYQYIGLSPDDFGHGCTLDL